MELRHGPYSYTGAMMIESAYHLLSGERPTADPLGEVPSAHNMSLAQSIRGETCRLLLTSDTVIRLAGLPANEPIDLELSEHDITGHWLIQPTRLGEEFASVVEQGIRGHKRRIVAGSVAPLRLLAWDTRNP